jgi:hypothetical protein
MAAVTFDHATWAATWPTLAAQIAQSQAQALFDLAALTLLDNTDSSPIPEGPRAALLGLLVAHLAALELRSAAAGGTGGMVGAIASAGEGSVSVSMASYPTDSGKWFEQTQWGAMFWQAVQPWLRFRYTPGPRACTGVPGSIGQSGW